MFCDLDVVVVILCKKGFNISTKDLKKNRYSCDLYPKESIETLWKKKKKNERRMDYEYYPTITQIKLTPSC